MLAVHGITYRFAVSRYSDLFPEQLRAFPVEDSRPVRPVMKLIATQAGKALSVSGQKLYVFLLFLLYHEICRITQCGSVQSHDEDDAALPFIPQFGIFFPRTINHIK